MNITVIGGGPGGYVAAITAAKKGAKVTLIEKDKLGGTCLNRGCIPTKAILHSVNLYDEAKNFVDLGINVENLSIDFAKVMERKDAVVSQLRRGVEFLLKKNGVEVICGEARFLSRGSIEIKMADGTKMEKSVDKVIIATGSKPSEIPAFLTNGRTILNSNHVLELKSIPDSMVIIGGGVIGCEFAQAFARMGCKVTIIEMLPRLVANMDVDLSTVLQKSLKRDGVDVFLSAAVTAVMDMQDNTEVTYKDALGTANVIAAEKVLVAPGRKPATQDLCAEAAGVKMERGFIPVDKTMSTNVNGIYAVGDVTGNIQLAHVASHQGIVAVENIFGEQKEVDYSSVPMCIYTSPELASMGKTKETAEKEGYEVKTGVFNATVNGRAMIEGCKDGLSKVVVDAQEGTILGIHLAGPNVTEMISGMTGVIKYESTTGDIAEWIFAHPSVSEIIHESVLDADKKAIHKI